MPGTGLVSTEFKHSNSEAASLLTSSFNDGSSNHVSAGISLVSVLCLHSTHTVVNSAHFAHIDWVRMASFPDR